MSPELSARLTANGDIARIGIVGGGPAALVMAIALARRGISTRVFERDLHPESVPRFHPDRSYTIDTSGHGLRALRHIDATSVFDERVNRFKGIKILGRISEEWTEPGWTGSRGDYLRALMAIRQRSASGQDRVAFRVQRHRDRRPRRVGDYTAQTGTRDYTYLRFVDRGRRRRIPRRSLEQQSPGFTVTARSYPM